ncbi:hypothetical protein ACIQXF_17445 [Lysinibacillus sp. NPDC097231]|uniref:hypothetical protein n=1 Tax=Lysinibacillus sp. NPDC097231 TaxID=3364142 RepID=UPI00382301C6
MKKDISFAVKYPKHLKIRDSEDTAQIYVIKITKEQVDRLIEEIDKTLKASY